jgi:predicted cation transporter
MEIDDDALEEYDAELERMNASVAAENQALQHDNKQLSSLIKEYEQTLETVMSRSTRVFFFFAADKWGRRIS